jgi:hypothetical protein
MARTQSATMAIPAFDPRSYDVRYQGRVTVTEYVGDHVIKAAQKRVKRESTVRPQAAKLFVSAEHIVVSRPEEDGDVLYDSLISEVKFVSLNPTDKRGLSLVTVDKNKMGFCHFFSVVSAEAAQVRDAVGQAFRAAAEVEKRDDKGGLSSDTADYARRMTRMASDEIAEAARQATEAVAAQKSGTPQSEAQAVASRNAVAAGRDASAIMGTFEMTHLGSAPVQQKSGKDVAVAAIASLLVSSSTPCAPCACGSVFSPEGARARTNTHTHTHRPNNLTPHASTTSHTHTHTLSHSLTHSLTQSLTHSPTHSNVRARSRSRAGETDKERCPESGSHRLW